MRGRRACFVAESMPSDACRARAVGCQRPGRLRTVRLVGSTEPFDPGRRRRQRVRGVTGLLSRRAGGNATSSSSCLGLALTKHTARAAHRRPPTPPRRTGPRPSPIAAAKTAPATRQWHTHIPEHQRHTRTSQDGLHPAEGLDQPGQPDAGRRAGLGSVGRLDTVSGTLLLKKEGDAPGRRPVR